MSRNTVFDRHIASLKESLESVPESLLVTVPRARFVQLGQEILTTMHAVYEAKDADYSSNGKPMGNFRTSEEFGVPAWKAILIRMNDKKNRVDSFLTRGVLLVDDEKAHDTLVDLANYGLLGLCLFEEEFPDEQQEQALWVQLSLWAVVARVLFSLNSQGTSAKRWDDVPWKNVKLYFERIAAFARLN